MIGFPDETKEELELTLNYIENSSFDDVGINIVMAYPGTRLYKKVYGNDKLIIPEFGNIDLSQISSDEVKRSLRKYSANPKVSLSKYVTIEELYNYKKEAYERFYRRKHGKA